MARQERQLHMQLYPGWSARDNYGYGTKKKKRKKERTPVEPGGISTLSHSMLDCGHELTPMLTMGQHGYCLNNYSQLTINIINPQSFKKSLSSFITQNVFFLCSGTPELLLRERIIVWTIPVSQARCIHHTYPTTNNSSI